MSAAKTLSLAITPGERDVLRYLGYPPSKTPRPSIDATLRRLWARARTLTEARGAYRLVDRRAALAASMPAPTARVIVGLCTVGPALEAHGDSLAASGTLLEALFFDAYGSAAAELAANQLNRAICLDLQPLGLIPRPRISPGYGDWSVTSQPALLSLLPAAALGVELGPAMMMLPRKSVSFAIRLGPASETAALPPTRRRCTCCDKRDCVYRDREIG